MALLALLALTWPGSVLADAETSFCGRTLEGWIDVLRHGAIAEREDAAWALSYFGAEAARAVPELTAMLASDRVGRGVVVALGRIGPEAAPAVPFLLKRFQEKGGAHLTGTGTFLVDASVRHALVRIGEPSVPGLLDILNGPDPDMRVCAAEALGGIGPGARAAVPALVRALRANDPVLDDKARILRDHAIVALGKIGAAARPAVPALNRLLDVALRSRKDAFGSDEWPLVEALARIDEAPVAKLTEAFVRDGDSLCLARLGVSAKAAAPALRKALADRRPQVRIDAALALIAIEPPAPDAVAVLTEGLKHHFEESHFVYEPLGRLGPAASAALPTLIDLVEKGDLDFICPQALVRIDPEGRVCIPALITALKNQDSSIVQEACESLGILGPRAARAVPALIEAVFRDHDLRVGEEHPNVSAVKALVRIRPAAGVAIPRLIETLKIVRKSEDNELAGDRFVVAEAAARALGAFGPEARDAVPALIRVLESHAKDDEDWQLRREAAIALGRIGPDARVAIPVLRRILDEHPPRRSPGLGVDMFPQVEDGAAVALALLAPEGRAIAERWAARLYSPERRAIVFGAIGESSLEGELVSRKWLEDLNGVLAQGEREGNELRFVEDYFERLGSLGIGAESAIPRLKELGRHPNPWIRLWAGETLARIGPAK